MVQTTYYNQQDSAPKPRIHPFAGVVSSASSLVGDVVELGELQVSLARADAKKALNGSAFPLGLITVGVVGFISGIPLLGFALASWLETEMNWTAWKAQLSSGLLLVVIASLFAFIGYLGIRSAMKAFDRSSKELSNNVAWLKSLLKSQHSINTNSPDGDH